MKCQYCGLDFEEYEIDVSHDIPKYIGGTDADGRHNLCKICHSAYEDEVLERGLMYFVASLPEEKKLLFRIAAEKVKSEWFKEVNGDDSE